MTAIDRFDDGVLSLKLTAAHITLGQTPPQLAQPTTFQVLHLKDSSAHPATLRLSGDQFEIVEEGGAHSFSLSRDEISKVTTSGGDAEKSCLPNCTDQTLKFTRSTNTGKQATLQFALTDFETFVWWFQQQRR